MYQKTTSSSLFRFYFPPQFYKFHLSFFQFFSISQRCLEVNPRLIGNQTKLFQSVIETLTVYQVCDISLLDECINFELEIVDKLCRFVALYRSPSQTQDDFLSFSQNFELTLEKLSENNPTYLQLFGDFNAKLRHWYSQYTNTFQGISVENVASQFELHKIINEPTQILENSSSCIDLLFTSQPNLIVDSGTHPSLYPNCHHQIIYAKLNFKIHYPPPYTRVVWHYKDSNDDLIRRAINHFNWERIFENKMWMRRS